jgi:ATP-dependent helicase IRC3
MECVIKCTYKLTSSLDIDLLEVEKQAQIIEESKHVARNMPLDAPEELEDARSESPKAHLTITEYDSIFEVVDDCSGSKALHQVSHNAWVGIGDEAYVLGIKNGSIKVERREDG